MIPRLLATLALLLAAAPAPAAGWGLEQLMATLADNRGGRVSFVETRYMALLDAPIESSGELVYVAPSRLERHTVKPRPETMVLDGNTLQLSREGQTHTVRLRDYPEAAALIDSIRATLAGDRAALEKTYALKLSGGAERWALDLLPADPAVARLVSRIRLAGNNGEVREVDIFQADGDRSMMRIGKPQR
ncbi:outer membrane lipoprotein carrier protein LolA [Azoarcus indigens]|uniref:Outer membrane lipoprotein-sorting protein n=1 Tax=Azoarcus indigens TaxID=29545 RepID=A0A4R6DQ77_9RHOO|nr:LolA-related protein [Azoarcus indigens]NMG67509.1 outer membrane lipoprotein carrier protein LolA [Azoarcus indigens]TDN47107.1 outer membrane lipoprotein-sorting protein [Azoarcus indigens]